MNPIYSRLPRAFAEFERSMIRQLAARGRQVISVSTTYPVDVLVLIKLSCCPRVTAKYSGELAGNHVAELWAVTVAVVSIVAQIPALRL